MPIADVGDGRNFEIVARVDVQGGVDFRLVEKALQRNVRVRARCSG